MKETDNISNFEQYEELIEKLPNQLVAFPIKVLALIEKLFGYDKLMFFPVQNKIMRTLRKTKSEVYRNFVTLNMSHEAVKEYRTRIRHVDVFEPKSLPEMLKEAPVVFTSDIMDHEAYKRTEHYKAMHALGLEQQACINLTGKYGKPLAKIVVFRNEKEMPFSEDDRIVMRRISKILLMQYDLLLDTSDESLLERGFELLLKSSNIGAIVVNHRLTVIQANCRAFELTETFLDEFRSEHDYFLKNNKQVNERYKDIQEMIDWVGLELISAGSKEYKSISSKYTFFSSAFSFIDSNGDVEINHLILITYLEKKINAETGLLYEKLTPREQTIVRQIVAGLSNDEMAEHNHISKYTIRTHISNIYQKFGVNSRYALLLKFKEIE